MHWLVDCGQSLFCSKICKREYLSSEVVRVARGRVVGEGGEGNTNKKRDCNGFIQHFGAWHSGDGPMAGQDDAHLSSTAHQHHWETRPAL